MYALLLFLLLGGSSYKLPPGDAQQMYNDSLLIYNIYKTQIQTLRDAKETDRNAWYRREAMDDSTTACAFLRLQQYNKERYLPIDELNKEGMGVAYMYPVPSVISYPGQFVSTTPTFRYATLDMQTHFITDSTGKTRIPYVIKYYYDKQRLLFKDTLNPITLEKLRF